MGELMLEFVESGNLGDYGLDNRDRGKSENIYIYIYMQRQGRSGVCLEEEQSD